MSEPTEQPKPNPQLQASRHHLPAVQVRNVHAVIVQSGLTREQILHPDFWGGIAAKIRQYDHIEVTCDDDSFYAELLVTLAERTHAFTRVLSWHDLTAADAAAKGPVVSTDKPMALNALKTYEVKHRGQHFKWCVIRLSDNEPVREREVSKKAAEAWLDDYLRITTTT